MPLLPAVGTGAISGVGLSLWAIPMAHLPEWTLTPDISGGSVLPQAFIPSMFGAMSTDNRTEGAVSTVSRANTGLKARISGRERLFRSVVRVYNIQPKLCQYG
jgi:hypothetical protein